MDKENAETKGGLLHVSGDDTVIEDNGIKFKKLAEMERQNVRVSRWTEDILLKDCSGIPV